jgi:serine/threonine-protein kinase 24/25/MST4
MRVLFIIPRDPPPSLEGRGAFSEPFKSFVGACLQKDPANRPTTEALAHHPFIVGGCVVHCAAQLPGLLVVAVV